MGDVVVDRARREVVDEPWFLVVLVGVVVGLLVVVSCVIVAILYQRHVSRDRKASKQPVLDGQSFTSGFPSPRGIVIIVIIIIIIIIISSATLSFLGNLGHRISWS